nr:MAG TPA: hypothetical protein [Caudoviricetes sp.]
MLCLRSFLCPLFLALLYLKRETFVKTFLKFCSFTINRATFSSTLFCVSLQLV